MSSVAIIGSGISGLAAAYYLSRKHSVTVFEKDTRIGGHTHTVMVNSSNGPLPVDTGFIVHNERTYPNFCRLMRELGVETQASDMSFAVTDGGGFEYSSRGAKGFFAQRSNLLSPAHFSLLREILRFNREAPALLKDLPTDDDKQHLTLGAYLDAGGYSDAFRERYLVPMAAAVWSMAPEDMAQFPALTLVRFFQNHGMLGINTHPQWRTIRGGSHRYLGPLTAPFSGNIELGVQIQAVTRRDNGVLIEATGRPVVQFDEVVFACHGNQILPLLGNPTEIEREILGNFSTSRNEAVLHTDETLLPRREDARASWNYLLGDRGKVTLTYHMNRLQSLATPENYCVSLNANGQVDKSRELKRILYHHPIYNRAAIRAQDRWAEISGRNRTHFCGAYWFYGFHEDGVKSALRVAAALGVSTADAEV